MREIPQPGRHIAERSVDPSPAGELSQVCSSMAEICSKLDRIEDALHDIAQVLARAVGPPWDDTEN